LRHPFSALTTAVTTSVLLVNAGGEMALLPGSAYSVDELLLSWLAMDAFLDEGEDRETALQRLLELLLGRAQSAQARLAVLSAEQQQVGVTGWDLVKQRPARVLVARGPGLEHDGIHPKRLDRGPGAVADGGHVTAEQRADEILSTAHKVGHRPVGMLRSPDASARAAAQPHGSTTTVARAPRTGLTRVAHPPPDRRAPPSRSPLGGFLRSMQQ
jgi:hypothetical protein